jgi:hypothetical protein
MARKWAETRERGIRPNSVRTLCRLHKQMANYPPIGPTILAEEIAQQTGMNKRRAYDFAKALVLIRRTEDEKREWMKAIVARQGLARLAIMDKPAQRKWLRSFNSEFKHLLEDALGQSRESEKLLQSISRPASIGFDNLTDMPFMKRAHIYVMSLKCPYGKSEVSFIPCPKRFLEEEEEKELPEVCDHTTCPRMKYDLPLSQWTAKVRMTIPSDDLPRFLSGLTKEIKNTLEDAKQATP